MSETDTRPVVGYGIDDPEILIDNEDELECVETYLDRLHGEPLPRTLVLRSYKRMDAASRIMRSEVLEALMEDVEENFGGEHRNPEDAATPAMAEAEKAFLAVVAAEYVPWQCEVDPTLDLTIDVEAWVREHCPGWLSETCSWCKGAGVSPFRKGRINLQERPCSFCEGTGKREPVTFLPD